VDITPFYEKEGSARIESSTLPPTHSSTPAPKSAPSLAPSMRTPPPQPSDHAGHVNETTYTIQVTVNVNVNDNVVPSKKRGAKRRRNEGSCIVIYIRRMLPRKFPPLERAQRGPGVDVMVEEFVHLTS
jgi:hypothetical protein